MKQKLRDIEKPNMFKDILRIIASFQIKHPYITVIGILLITIAFIGGISQVKTVSSLEQMMPKDVQEIKAFNTLRDQGLGQDMIAIIVGYDEKLPESSVFSPELSDISSYELYLYVKKLAQTIKQKDAVISVYSFADIIDFAYMQSESKSKTVLSEQLHSEQFVVGSISSKEKVLSKEQYDSLKKNSLLESQLLRFINQQRTKTILIVTTDVSANDNAMNLLATSIQEELSLFEKPAYISLSVTGTPLVQQRLGKVIEHDREITERLSALFVFILVAIVFGSVIAAFVPMITIILSIIWLYGSMGYLHLPISTLAGGVAAMVIGIGVDFSIHLRNKFEYERKKGESLAYAVEETMANTGYVLSITTIVLALAFLSFLVGTMPEMGRFGLLMTIGVSLAFILSVIGLPAFFILEEKLIYWVKSHLRFGVEHELVLRDASDLSHLQRNSADESIFSSMNNSANNQMNKHSQHKR
jgi:uncharacterized protein